MRALILASVFALLAILITPWIGPGALSPARVVAGDSLERQIFVEFRLSRTLLAALAGGALSLAGCLFQGMLRNSLATPYTLGVSSGAALGAVLLIVAGAESIWLGAVAGALATLGMVLGFAWNQRSLSAHGLILAGVAINSVCAALIMLIHNFAGFSQAFSIVVWLTGAVDGIRYYRLGYLAAAIAPLAALIVWQAPAWNLLALGEDWAAARGVHVRRVMLGGYLAGSLLAAATVSFTGPIGFVGLLVPHIVRRLAGPDHRILMPCSLLCGAGFLTICDAIGRTVLAPADVPVGVITALLGGPGLIWILRSQRVGSAS